MFDGYGRCFILSRSRSHLMILVGSVHINRWISKAPYRLKDRKINLNPRNRSYLSIADLQNFYFYLEYQIFAQVQIEFDQGQLCFDFRI